MTRALDLVHDWNRTAVVGDEVIVTRPCGRTRTVTTTKAWLYNGRPVVSTKSFGTVPLDDVQHVTPRTIEGTS